MTRQRLKVLLIEDDKDDYVLVRELLSDVSSTRYDLEWVNTYSDALEVMTARKHDVCLLDYRLGDRNGLSLLHEVSRRGYVTPVIFLTGQGDHKVDIEAMKAGSADYLVKGQTNSDLLERSIRYAIERRLAEKLLREHVQLLQTLIDTIPNPIFLVDTRAVYQRCNVAFEKYLGVDRKAVVGRSIHDLYAPYFADRFRRMDLELFENPRLDIREVSVPFSGGARRDVILIKAPFVDGDGVVTGLVGVMVDITGRKRGERELKAAKARAEAASSAKTDFMATMSHELLTPLNAIIGFTRFLLDRGAGELNPSQEEYLNDAHGSARQLLALIDSMLDLTQMEAGKLEMELHSISLKDLLARCISMVGEKAAARGIRITTEMKMLVPEAIVGDEARLRQVLYNLLSNAIKFSPTGGDVRVVIQCASAGELQSRGIDMREAEAQPARKPDVAEQECFAHLSVSDSGIGISRDNLDRIFTPFGQLDTSLNRKYQGVGLGLALARKLVELHHGRIWAESEGEGKGSCFHVAVPAMKRLST